MGDEVADPKHFADVERLSFAQHRKTLRNHPKGVVDAKQIAAPGFYRDSFDNTALDAAAFTANGTRSWDANSSFTAANIEDRSNYSSINLTPESPWAFPTHGFIIAWIPSDIPGSIP